MFPRILHTVIDRLHLGAGQPHLAAYGENEVNMEMDSALKYFAELRTHR